ncbi:MAG TPA: hypothetical protein DDX89_08780 [Candidatus Omnitrophica bacterium]|nr:MAG: hypothetical protein A3I71_03625 [Omnitrophica WOR_2 bacterium RIFCSPLOWO2_02_FULL_63_16]OGX49494.1 MAG: hypothetical protein A3G88_07265 [Omnitrophica WOR_2 bacterium RIFCSPLOWO2_12_FULL_63_16]HBH97855.1 hypothetical protein [Candidatus Omnitrophota bacterium]HBQ37618.1 hypothetical protein [Candidatus Omnitrophota bacterium]
MSVDFPIGTKVISLGRVTNPVVPILVRTRTGYAPFDFLVDTGADCSMMPVSVAETELGFSFARASQETFFGIEGSGLRVYRGWVSLKIGPYPLRVRCVFSPHERSPLILGRMDVFRHFTIAFDNRFHRIRFTKLTR